MDLKTVNRVILSLTALSLFGIILAVLPAFWDFMQGLPQIILEAPGITAFFIWPFLAGSLMFPEMGNSGQTKVIPIEGGIDATEEETTFEYESFPLVDGYIHEIELSLTYDSLNVLTVFAALATTKPRPDMIDGQLEDVMRIPENVVSQEQQDWLAVDMPIYVPMPQGFEGQYKERRKTYQPFTSGQRIRAFTRLSEVVSDLTVGDVDFVLTIHFAIGCHNHRSSTKKGGNVPRAVIMINNDQASLSGWTSPITGRLGNITVKRSESNGVQDTVIFGPGLPFEMASNQATGDVVGVADSDQTIILEVPASGSGEMSHIGVNYRRGPFWVNHRQIIPIYCSSDDANRLLIIEFELYPNFNENVQFSFGSPNLSETQWDNFIVLPFDIYVTHLELEWLFHAEDITDVVAATIYTGIFTPDNPLYDQLNAANPSNHTGGPGQMDIPDSVTQQWMSSAIAGITRITSQGAQSASAVDVSVDGEDSFSIGEILPAGTVIALVLDNEGTALGTTELTTVTTLTIHGKGRLKEGIRGGVFMSGDILHGGAVS